jgi:hypothetical protein
MAAKHFNIEAQHGFDVAIKEAGPVIEGAYVTLQHGQQYTVSLTNQNVTPCEVDMTIDGQHMGKVSKVIGCFA